MRKGPEHVPASWLLLAVSIGLLAAASFCGTVLIERLAQQDLRVSVLTHMLGLAFYGTVLFVTGFGHRILQALTCVIGCGAVLVFLFVAEYVLFRPFLGTDVAGLIAALIILWSVPVEGHIISRSIQQHWFVGVAIAVASFILQLGLQAMMDARA